MSKLKTFLQTMAEGFASKFTGGTHVYGKPPKAPKPKRYFRNMYGQKVGTAPEEKRRNER